MVFVPGYYDGAPPPANEKAQNGGRSHQGTKEETATSSQAELNPDMEIDNCAENIITELISDPPVSVIEKESPADGVTILPKSTVRVEINKERGKESVTVHEQPVSGESYVEGNYLGQSYDGDPFLAKLDEIDRDLRKFEDENYGRVSGDNGLANKETLCTSTILASNLNKVDRQEEKCGLGATEDCGLQPSGPIQGISPLGGDGLELNKSRSALLDLSNRIRLPKDPQAGLEGKWTKLD